jgi:hypothetical protein
MVDLDTNAASRPSPNEARKRADRHPASDAAQRTIWIAFFVALAVLVTGGVMLGLRSGESEGRTAPMPRSE